MMPEPSYTERFTFGEIAAEFDEEGYLTARRLIQIAAGLIEPSEPNPEYERGMAELVTEAIGLSMDYAGQVLAEIRAVARH